MLSTDILWGIYIKIFHPNACLHQVRNVRSGLDSRTKILNILERQSLSAGKLSKQTRLTYDTVMHHLRLLESENIVQRIGKRPYLWRLTGKGQKRLDSM